MFQYACRSDFHSVPYSKLLVVQIDLINLSNVRSATPFVLLLDLVASQSIVSFDGHPLLGFNSCDVSFRCLASYCL